MTPAKAVPVVLRQRGEVEVLAFRHPLAGNQLVKGTIEPDETAEAGALRELAEESGISNGRASGRFGSDTIGGTVWHFVRVAVADLPDAWSFRTGDDGGHDFAFFWHPLSGAEGADWHPDFRRALAFIRDAVS